MRGRGILRLAALPVAMAVLCLATGTASATQFQRPLVETFGSAEQPTFQIPESIGINQQTGEVLVGVRSANLAVEKTAIFRRFDADGTAAPFSALGSNVIDGKVGSGGKPCAEEPESCDKTPQEGLSIGNAGYPSDQIAFDPTNGNIYITQNAENVVDIFSSAGKYLGQLTQAGAKLSNPCGVSVDSAGTVYIAQNNKISVFVPSGDPPVNADFKINYGLPKDVGSFCRVALGSGPSAGSIFITNTGNAVTAKGRVLKVSTATGSFSVFAEGYEGIVAVDPTSGNPIIFDLQGSPGKGFGELAEFDGSLEAAGEALSKLITKPSKLASVADFATDSVGEAYVANRILGYPQTNILVYGQPVVAPTVSVGSASDVSSNRATLTGTINPEDVPVTQCYFEYGRVFGDGSGWQHTIPCEETIDTDSGDHPVRAMVSGLTANGVEYQFRLAAENENGVTEYSTVETLATGSASETKPAAVTGISTATLKGEVHPEDVQYTECFFEWGVGGNGAPFDQKAPCSPTAGEIPADDDAYPVTSSLSGLGEGTTYHFRLVAKQGAAVQTGDELSFETFGPPQIGAVRASDATQSSAKLEAEIDPSGFPASYRFEWGPTASYGHLAPAGFEAIGSGTAPIRVSAEIAGLSAATTYHYRVVASGGAGTTPSSDRVLETLNSCDLPDGRCFELVSPREPGRVALPLERIAGFQLPFQAAELPGRLAYEVELGFDGVTTGGEAVYVGSRDENGWESAQYNPSLAGPGQGGGVRYAVLGLSPNLDCGVAVSKVPLTADPVADQIIEAGGANLYRRGPSGSYTLITDRTPEQLKSYGEIDKEFRLIGMSDDCQRVVFSTEHRYAGVPGAGDVRLYEWDAGGLRNVGWVPSAGGEVVAEASGGLRNNTYNAVSEDGSRVFFTAKDQAGNRAVFARIDGTETLNVSQSSLKTNVKADYQGATPDGSRVYFTASAGLTAESNSNGLDLYECHIISGASGPECVLTDLSVSYASGGAAEVGGQTSEAEGSDNAQIGALVGLADDGSRVYFIARGQLIPGQGRTLAENEAAESFSLYVYEAASASLRYVAAISKKASIENVVPVITTSNIQESTSRVSRDGRYLLFESRENLTGYDSHGEPMAYLYDAEGAGGEGTLVCISCRQDGKPTINPGPVVRPAFRALPIPGRSNPNYQPQSLVVRDGEPLVFFRSMDGLASGGVEGEWGVYEWAHGQVFNIASDLPGVSGPSGSGIIEFLGASSDGGDLYLVDSAPLNWENPDTRRSVWDARIGGGFPEPPPPAIGCDPNAEGSCQGAAAPTPAVPAAGSATFNGPGNVTTKPKRHRKKHHKRHKKHRKKNVRHANGSREAGQ